ncbi:nuclear transcription factor Y subunit B-5-like [Sesamum indicum]|uniref:Nuclear transcription factor Y subunit B-5-like n=1 Tax=Sesamum indicum TaxID=4182 RepID=A0A6I9TFF1_SESIN|nr:nuclear transcription factor Y subunit B-5-like [Sesamum indicum]
MFNNIGPKVSDIHGAGFTYSYAAPSSRTGGDQEDYHDHDHDHQGGLIKEQDRLLPIANVGRIMKQILPPNAKISKEAKETMQECVSEFISFVTGEASDKCHKEKRKTVNGDDICWALGSLGFDEYAQSLKRYLSKYREAEGERVNQNRAHYSGHEEIRIDDSSNGRAAPVALRVQGVSPPPFSYNNLMEKRTI